MSKKPKNSKKPKGFFGIFWHTIWSIFKFLIPVVFVLGVAFLIFIIAAADPLDVDDLRLDLTSSICYLDENGEVKEIDKISGSENRFWVEYSKGPQ